MAFRRFFDLRGFASLPFHCRRLNFRFAAKRRKSKKVGHVPVPASRGRAPAATCDNQQNARGPLTSRQKRNAADARPWVEDIRCPCPRATLLRSHAPTAYSPRSRVSAFCMRRSIKGPSVLCRRLLIVQGIPLTTVSPKGRLRGARDCGRW